MEKKTFTYKDSGVDIKAGEELVHSIKDLVKETHGVEVLSNIGGFGGFFKPNLTTIKNPVFVSSVDGVGTKLIVAYKAQKYDTVGQDLVNHCMNDIAVCGATPLFFLDYFSTGKLEQKTGVEVIKGFVTACKENNVALIGGETAEMPDIYKPGEFDLAGTIVGIVDENEIIKGDTIFCATAITDTMNMKGVKVEDQTSFTTETLVTHKSSKLKYPNIEKRTMKFDQIDN